jgi:hypothetical protein
MATAMTPEGQAISLRDGRYALSTAATNRSASRTDGYSDAGSTCAARTAARASRACQPRGASER